MAKSYFWGSADKGAEEQDKKPPKIEVIPLSYGSGYGPHLTRGARCPTDTPIISDVELLLGARGQGCGGAGQETSEDRGDPPPPLSSELGAYKTAKTRSWS